MLLHEMEHDLFQEERVPAGALEDASPQGTGNSPGVDKEKIQKITRVAL
jgi:hypothetical protein